MNRNPKFFIVFTIIGLFTLLFASCLDEGPEIPSWEEQLQTDIAIIDKYLDDNNIQALTHLSGLRYEIHSQGSGNQPTIDSCVTTTYKGSFLANGQAFDDGLNISFPLSAVIEGWQIGMPLLHEGDSATLYIPSGLAYGYYGYPPTIPRDANLIFNVRLISVGRTYQATPSPNGSCQ